MALRRPLARTLNREIGRACGFENKLVGDIRSLCSEHSDAPAEPGKFTTKHDTVAMKSVPTATTGRVGAKFQRELGWTQDWPRRRSL